LHIPVEVTCRAEEEQRERRREDPGDEEGAEWERHALLCCERG
jgi:hypothetical protein